MAFTPILISWYESNKRDLPFRGTKDPYLIWVSEVILQQTRMEQGIGYYRRFVERFPDVHTLAEASEEEVLKQWEGLGYYSRARNLHASAREIMGNRGGLFPKTYSEIRKLKGIGDYSAASIASLAFDEPYAAVDGNVYRFLARQFGFNEQTGSVAGKKRAVGKAAELMDRDRPGMFNQAMIEYGALVCTPVNPACSGCIFQSSCHAFIRRMVSELPRRARQEATRLRYFHYLVITRDAPDGQWILLNKRSGNDIWKNLYDFPLIETSRRYTPAGLRRTPAWRSLFPSPGPVVSDVSDEVRHLLSHQTIVARFYRIHPALPLGIGELEIPLTEIARYPFPRLISTYLARSF